MQQRMLGLEGNFATIGSEKDADSRVEGTFALSHQLFFERFLLPALQPFVRDSQVFQLEPTFIGPKDGYDNYSISEPYWVGYNPDKDPNQDATNPIYKFTLVVDPAGNGKNMCYQATVPNARDTPIKRNDKGNNWNKLWSDGTPVVTVRWEIGGTKIFVDGKTLYQTHITTGNHQNVDPGSHWLVPATIWSHIKWDVTWKMEIDAKAVDGSIHFALNAADDMVKVTPTEDMNGWHWEIAGTTKKITDEIQQRVTKQLGTLKETLKQGFEGQLRFNYPGYGKLVFKKSIFNQAGDFIASILYADMPPPDPKNRIIIPPPNHQTPAAGATDPVKGQTGGSATGGAPRLTWTGNSPVVASPPAPPPPKKESSEKDGATSSGSAPAPPAPSPMVDRRVVFSVKGTNTTEQTHYFSQIKLNYTGNSKALQTLLKAVKFVLGGGNSTADQNVVEFKVETSAGATQLNNPQLKPKVYSPHMIDCAVVLTPGTGNVISVPPGGVITVAAKSVSGSKGSKNYYVDVEESWVNSQGEVTPGAPEGFRARVPFQLV